MNIEKLPSGSYRVRKMYEGKRYSLTFDSKPTKAQIEKAMYEKVKEKPADKSLLTFQKAAEQYCSDKDGVLSPKTIREYIHMLDKFPEWFTSLKISDITQPDLNRFVNELSKINSPKTVRNKHGLVVSVINTYRPSLKVNTSLPQAHKDKIYIPTEKELKMILNELEGTMFYVPVVLACMGLRRSEIMALTPEDIDGNVAHINKAMVQDVNKDWVIKSTKTTESERDIVLPDDIVKIIKEQGYVYNGSPNSIICKLTKVQDKLGIQHFSLHKLRHYFASKMLTITDSKTVQALGGWKTDEVMKKVYAHSLEEEKEKAKAKAVGVFADSLLN